jgi:hypothetical protein
MTNEETFPEQIGFSMAPFGYVFTLNRYPDGAYGCGGRDRCNAKHWPNVGESLEDFKLRLGRHVYAAH